MFKRSADYYKPSKTCYINTVSKNEKRSSYLASSNYIYLHKTCKIENRKLHFILVNALVNGNVLLYMTTKN